MKKEEKFYKNDFGLASTILGIMSLVGSGGIITGIIAIIFSKKQEKIKKNKWSKAGFILGICGLILNIILIAIGIYLANHPEFLSIFNR